MSIELKNDAAIINVGGLRVYINAFQQDGDMFMWPKIQTLNNNTTCLLGKVKKSTYHMNLIIKIVVKLLSECIRQKLMFTPK